MPLVGDERLPEGFSRAWDYRIGLALNFGGGRSRGRGGDDKDIPRPPRPEPVASASASRVLASADRYVGTRYRYGGSTREGGFDCSGFVQHVFAEHGVSLPRVSRQQALVGRGVVPLLDALTPGDLVFFAQNGTRIDHVAIYTGRGRIIHSSSSGGGVRYDELASTGRGKWFLEHIVAARRILNDGRSPTAPAVATQPPAVPRPPAVAQVAPDSLDPPDRAPEPVP